jgi:hypothetical protein
LSILDSSIIDSRFSGRRSFEGARTARLGLTFSGFHHASRPKRRKMLFLVTPVMRRLCASTASADDDAARRIWRRE